MNFSYTVVVEWNKMLFEFNIKKKDGIKFEKFDGIRVQVFNQKIKNYKNKLLFNLIFVLFFLPN